MCSFRIALACAIVFVAACTKDDVKKQDPNSQLFAQMKAVETVLLIENREWCQDTGRGRYSETKRLKFTEESVEVKDRFQFKGASLPYKTKMLKFDYLRQYRTDEGWISYTFDPTEYEWQLSPTISVDKIRTSGSRYSLNLVADPNTHGYEKYLEIKSSLGPKHSEFFYDCTGKFETVQSGDTIDYALIETREKFLNGYHNNVYFPFDINFPTKKVHATGISDSYWCRPQSTDFLNKIKTHDFMKVIYFDPSGNIIKYILTQKNISNGEETRPGSKINFSFKGRVTAQQFTVGEDLHIFIPDERLADFQEPGTDLWDYDKNRMTFSAEIRRSPPQYSREKVDVLVLKNSYFDIFMRDRFGAPPSQLSEESLLFRCEDILEDLGIYGTENTYNWEAEALPAMEKIRSELLEKLSSRRYPWDRIR